MSEWRTIPSFPLYEASDEGEVRRREPFYISRGLIVLRPHRHRKTAYRAVSVRSELGRFITKFVHALVCEAFHGLRLSPKHEAAHWNGDKADNRPDNLRWATKVENAGDTNRLGRQVRGETSPNAVLTPDQVARIRVSWATLPRRANGRIKRGAVADLARELGANRRTVYSVGRGDTWRQANG